MTYVCYGTYLRSIIDLEPVKDANGMFLRDENGNICYKDPEWGQEAQKVRIRRILCTSEGDQVMHTHALLSCLIVPYSRYTVRFIVYHLNRLDQSEESMERYAQKHGLSVKLLNKWARDIERIVPILQQNKVMPETNDLQASGEMVSAIDAVEADPSETVQEPATTMDASNHPKKVKKQMRQDRKKWISWICTHFEDAWVWCLYWMHRTLFQRHRMPANTAYFRKPTK